MNEMIHQESLFFLASFLTGVILIWIYQILILFRRLVKHANLVTEVEDFLYWCVAAILIFGAAFWKNQGALRWYLAAAVILGAWAQWGVLFFLHRICIKLLKKFKNRGRMT